MTLPDNDPWEKRAEELRAEGWKLDFCSCGYLVITMPDGDHRCPRCNI